MAVGQSVKKEEYDENNAPVRKIVPVNFAGPLPQPTRSLEQVREDIDRAGYAILADVLTQDAVREARKILLDEIAREEAIDKNRVSKFFTDPDDRNRRLSRLPNRHRVFRDFLEHPVALELTKYILGPTLLNESYLVHSYGANVTRPGSAEQFYPSRSRHGFSRSDQTAAIALHLVPRSFRCRKWRDQSGTGKPFVERPDRYDGCYVL